MENFKRHTIAVLADKSDTEKVLDWLQTGKSLTQADAVKQFNNWRLAVIINRLRNRGYEISTMLIEGKKSKYALYYMPSHS